MSTCFRLTDWAVAAETLSKCWDEHAEDGMDFNPPNVVNEYWIGFLEGGQYAGLVRAVPLTSILYEAHICILKEFRKNARDYAFMAYGWMLDNLDINKLVVNVPECNKKTLVFCSMIGMQRQGYNSDSWVKDGEVCGMVQLGITKQRMGDLCLRQ